jgi:hypothetical protein
MKCGCTVNQFRAQNRIDFCDLHASAERMKEALQRCARIFEKGTEAITDVEWDEVYGLVEAALAGKEQ